MDDRASMRACMDDAGCSKMTIRQAEHFYQNGGSEGLIAVRVPVAAMSRKRSVKAETTGQADP